jgi:hypothetical protein
MKMSKKQGLEMNVDVDMMMAMSSQLPQNVKRKNACIIFWQWLTATLYFPSLSHSFLDSVFSLVINSPVPAWAWPFSLSWGGHAKELWQQYIYILIPILCELVLHHHTSRTTPHAKAMCLVSQSITATTAKIYLSHNNSPQRKQQRTNLIYETVE